MINEADKQLLLDLILAETEKFQLTKDQIFNAERLVYGDYWEYGGTQYI